MVNSSCYIFYIIQRKVNGIQGQKKKTEEELDMRNILDKQNSQLLKIDSI